MSEISAWDLDGTIRHGSLFADAVLHGIAEGFLDPSHYADPEHPAYEEAPYFVQSLKHQPHRVFRDVTDRLSDEARTQSYPWALERLDAHHAADRHVVVLSHSPDFLVEAFARGLGVVRHARGSQYHIDRQLQHFTGTATTLDKVSAALGYMRRHGIAELGFAAGDSMYDLPLLERAAHAAVVNPGGRLAELAQARQWEVIRTEEA